MPDQAPDHVCDFDRQNPAIRPCVTEDLVLVIVEAPLPIGNCHKPFILFHVNEQGLVQ